ncbi:FkbM family methyltransferase [Pedobacter hiemivivus]|uniref:FkbM family methyltransferase n=1 Tax=Pedobacter hiemivivus TaxID=2530454 RepID=A0A4U1G6C1_9SPHI|nr:FkbM family methyltransferase [Pedobacter hiemivivus]TKC59245.1 FkbM family methyltransferase [Pedobacter hiemivivus]
MKAIKELAKKVIKLHPQTDVKPLKNLIHVGSEHHGYKVPDNFLNKDSICYCIGAGEDITFDTELKVLYDSKIFIFDPMPEGVNYFIKLKDTVARGETFGVFDDPVFQYRINSQQLEEITYVNKGVWDENTILKFYAPDLENYISHSVYLFKDSAEYIEAPVDRLSNFMKEFNHSTVDLVKIEIEGAEYTVIDTIVKDKLDIKVIMIEFDEVYHAKGLGHKLRIKKACTQLKKAGYVLVHSTYMLKRTFVREDVYNQLKSMEL